MYVFFADDSKQNHPTRSRMGPLVASGGLLVPGDKLSSLERALSSLCAEAGFPQNEEFKWSPRRDMWMYQGLIAEQRKNFFLAIIQACVAHETKALVIMSDRDSRTPSDCATHEVFVTKMLLERVNNLAASAGSSAIVIVDRPGGGLAQERNFLSECLYTLQNGTRYVIPEKIAINPISTDSHLVRSLQVADLIVSCTTAFVAGQTTLAPDIFEVIQPILAQELNRAGGVGVKIHPDYKYLNLYHWLLGDEVWVRNMNAQPLPYRGRPYASGPDQF